MQRWIRFTWITEAFFLAAVHMWGQQSAPVAAALEPPPLPSSFTEMTKHNATSACLEPLPLPGLDDYNGPLKKTVGLFANALERTSVHASRPHYKAGLCLCTLDAKDKFVLFVQASIDPVTFLGAGFDALQDQAANRDPQFGQGVQGYGKRFGADLADRASSRFFKYFAYPTLFSEDPRYYRLGQGPFKKRIYHAAEHLFIAHHGNGARMFNYSEWLGTISSVELSNTYHPGNKHGFGPLAENVATAFASDVGFDVLREFWPELSRKFRLPFTR